MRSLLFSSMDAQSSTWQYIPYQPSKLLSQAQPYDAIHLHPARKHYVTVTQSGIAKARRAAFESKRRDRVGDVRWVATVEAAAKSPASKAYQIWSLAGDWRVAL
jgi:hypothetical protein